MPLWDPSDVEGNQSEARIIIDGCRRAGRSEKELDLGGLGLTRLPPGIGKLDWVEEVDLRGNRLEALPAEFAELQRLRYLDLRENRFKALPPEVLQLAKLEELILDRNQLAALPAQIGDLRSLQVLSLSRNRLATLPREIGKLFHLEGLWLDDNQLEQLPPDIRELTALYRLYLSGNPKLGLPEDALGPKFGDDKPPREILDYYFATRGAEGVALREMKLIVVGWGQAGKTTLVKRLANEPMNPTEPETHGILIRPLTLQCSDGALAARVWDFGGQHVLHAMHEFFLTARSLYLLVLEQRGESAERDAKYWLQLIRSYAPGAPVVIALNKSRGIARALDRASLEKAYGPIVGWVATECEPEKKCQGANATIAKLRDVLTEAAEEKWMPEPRKRFPKKWVAIKDWLEGLDHEGKNFLEYAAFARGCATRGESDPEKQREVAALMHDLGVAMNYARDERVRDTTVLRPDWLANGIYAVLRANLLLPGRELAPGGVLTAERLGKIYAAAAKAPVRMLKAKDYPRGKWKFLLRLMNLFQLTFPLSADGREQLCPTLLRAEPPEGTEEPQEKDAVRLRYEFDVVPAPLLPRFLVRTFSLIARGTIWQRGAILRFGAARARVWTTADDRYLFATIAGPEEERRELLRVLRTNLQELFREYRDLRVTEQQRYQGEWVPRKTLLRMESGVWEDVEIEDVEAAYEEAEEADA